MEILIGHLCMAVNRAEIELTAVQLERLAKELYADEIERQKKQQENRPQVEFVPLVHKQPAKKTEQPEPAEQSANDTDKKYDTDALDNVVKSEMVKEKPKKATKASGTNNGLTPRQQQFWDYVQSHPGSSVAQTCTDLKITAANYYWLARQLKLKGYVIPKNMGTGRRLSKKTQYKIRELERSDMDKRMDDAYMGEHFEIQPDPVPKKPVSKQAMKLYEYMQSHPDSRMPKTCQDMNISTADYYLLKERLKQNGWIESAVENVKAIN